MTDTMERPAEGRAAGEPACAGCADGAGQQAPSATDLGVCLECGHHHALTAAQRIEQLFDPGSVQVLDAPVRAGDPLGFVDRVPYPERLREAQLRTGLPEAVSCVQGTVHGHPLVAAVMDFRFLGGSLGTAAGELVTRAAEKALRDRTPLLLVTASGGARMQEGALSLMQMAKTSQAMGQLDAAGVLTVSLVTDPTYGGVAASYASLSDVIIAEPGARLGFAGPRVIEQTIRQTLPPGFQTAEALLGHGLVDGVHPRAELRTVLARLLAAAAGPTAEVPGHLPQGAGEVVIRDPGRLGERSPWQAVKRARNLARPTTSDYLRLALNDFVELHGDRAGGDDPAIVGGLGRLGDRPVVAIGHQKGHDMSEVRARNFGMAMPAGYRKAARLMRLAAKLRLPVLTLVDTPGAYPGMEAEDQGQAFAIADNLRLMAALPVPVVAVVTGEGGSGGALALAVADQVLMCENAVYSVISPEGCAAILWRDRSAAPQAAAALRVDARQLLELGVADGVVPEPHGGSEADHAGAARRLRDAVTATLSQLSSIDPAELVARRQRRFRRIDSGMVAGGMPA